MPNYEYNKDYPFAAFITNLGKYNEGELVGEWVKFPTTAEELKNVFERIGIGSKDDFGAPYEEWFITDYDCYVDGLYDKLGEYANLDELNYLASKLDEMQQYEYDTFQAAMELGDHTGSIQDLINLTENLDCYDIYYGVHDHDDLGRYYVEELGTMQVPEHLQNYIDYEAYGRDIALDENGAFTDSGYVYDNGNCFEEVYDGDRESIPEEYRIMGTAQDMMEENLDMEPEKLTVLVVEPLKEPYKKEISTGLSSLQAEVGGYIQAVYPYEDAVALVCNEEGKLEGLPLNRALRDEDGDVYDIVAGTFLVVGLGDENFASIPPGLAEKYTEQFKMPEQFVQMNGKIVVLPAPVEEPKAITPDERATAERISTPRGSFRVTDMSREQMEAAGYGFHHQSEDRKYLIMSNGTRAFAIPAQQQEQESHIRTAEMTVEDDYGMIDGVINNGRRGEELEKAKEEAERSAPEKKPSIKERLAEAKKESAQLAQAKKDMPHKKPPELGEL